MKIAFVADVHLANFRQGGGVRDYSGLNTRGRLAVDTLEFATRTAVAHGCAELIVLGDLFDSARPEPAIIAGAFRALFLGGSRPPLRITLLRGNHDSGTNGLGALAPFDGFVDVVTHVRSRMRSSAGYPGLLLVPYAGQEKPADLIRAHLEGNSKIDIVCLHAGISDGLTPPWLLDAHDSVQAHELWSLAREFGLKAILAGNWHDYRVWDGRPMGLCPIIQVGALCPTGWDNEGPDYGQVVMLDTEDYSWTVVRTRGPRFFTVNYEDLPTSIKTVGGCEFLRVRCPPGREEAATALLEEQVRLGPLCGFVVQTVVPEPVTQVAQTARGPLVSAEQAVAEYPLGEHTEAARQRALDYLRSA